MPLHGQLAMTRRADSRGFRLAGELSNGRCRAGSPVRLSENCIEISTRSGLRVEDFCRIPGAWNGHALGKTCPQLFRSPCPKEMQEAYEIRAALEEIGGRAATRVLKGNTSELQRELEAMRAAFNSLDLDSFVEHDVTFHRRILQASGNEVLLRVWDSLAVDLRIRGAIEWVFEGFPRGS